MKSNHQPNTKSSPRNYITEHHIHTSLKNIWGWQFHHCTGPPLPLPNHWTAGRISSWQQSKPPPAQLETISSCSVICHVRKQTTTLFTTTSFQAITDSNEVCSQPPLCWAKQPQFPHMSFSSFFSSFIALLWIHSSSSITFSCWEAKLNTARKVQSHHHCTQENNSLPCSLLTTLSDAGHVLLASLPTWVHCRLPFSWLWPAPRVLFCSWLFSLSSPGLYCCTRPLRPKDSNQHLN